MTEKRRDIPTPASPNFSPAVREYIQTALGRTGNALDKVVTFRELKSLGLVTGGSGIGGSGGFFPVPGGGSGGSGGYTPDLTPPPTPTGFSVSSGVSYVFMETDQPLFTMGHGYERTNVYGKIRVAGDPAPTFADAVQITDFIGTIGAYATNPVTTWHLWVTWVTRDGVESLAPAGGTNGMVATTGQDVRSLLNAITKAAEAPSAPFSRLAVRAGLFYVANDVANTTTPLFSVVTVPITMNGVPVPTGVYMADAFIMNGTITNAKMANLSVDNAKVANMAVSKLLAGSMVIGQWITSANYVAGQQGWSINAAGNAEFHNATVRGTIYASAGSIGGILINGSAIYSSNYTWQGTGFAIESNGNAHINSLRARGAIMGGSYGGYYWPAAGQTGYYLGAEGLLVGNANNGSYFQLDSWGNLYAPNFSIVNGAAYFNGGGTFNGNGTFWGDLSAAGGSFSGVLTAAAVNAVDSINIAGQAVTTLKVKTGSNGSPIYGGDTNDNWITLISEFAVLKSGGNGIIVFVEFASGLTTGNTQGISFRLLNQSGQELKVWTFPPSSEGGGIAGGDAMTPVVDAGPVAGTNTYTLQTKHRDAWAIHQLYRLTVLASHR